MSQSPAGHCAAIWTARLGYCRFSGWRFEGMRETMIAQFNANAEIAKLGSLADTTQDSFDVLRVNFRRSYFNVQNALPPARKLNAIGFTASLSDQVRIAGTSAVSASKAALCNLTRALGAQLIRRSVRVNAKSSGVIESPLFRKIGITEGSVQERGTVLLEQIPAKHFGKPRKIAARELPRFGRRILHHRHRRGCRWQTPTALSPTSPDGLEEPP
ncbi:SDR family oxidoreductase [Bradyrhizobium sp. 139]|uniref:SDR family oxidoreductase n=1 Tax=Bradyrhizobium sp. 139 TaxID=2782616 RepID=UPI001FF7200C|nr:SDR family oxidoreductase [Bradyrhizobium sp. 139]MCK1745240.1 SDR family oxidoreductase [Bradyrhizobium sp. 139]